jgi:hypothetical protein
MLKWIMPRGMSGDGRAGDNSAAWISKILQYHRCRARAESCYLYAVCAEGAFILYQ